MFITVGLSGCEKDPEISPSPTLENLESVLLQNDKVLIDTIYAHAGNHPNFERETDQYDVHLRFQSRNNMTSVMIYINDSIANPDSLALFQKVDLIMEPEFQGLFTNILLKQEQQNEDFFIRVLYTANDTVFLTRTVRIRTAQESTDTKNVRGISIETTPGGRAFFDWTGSSVASDDNLIEIADATGKTFCAMVTSDPTFLFHNLRNVTHDFTPELFAPRLVQGESFNVNIYMTDNTGWMRNYRNFSFTADSTKKEFFE
tara:strand:- start:975 stop:1751 length:777 start_codon:yes stop_codon:yes gene_type:complete